jgi:hypothetical protein
MTWLTPLAGVILAAAVIPPLILLYFLKLRRKPQAISTTLLWKRSIEDLRANAPFQRLRRNLLLLLQLLALLLLAASVAQPQLQGGRIKSGKTVILIDNSASMTSRDAGGGAETRLEDAKRRASERVELLYSGGLFASSDAQTMVIAFSDRAEICSRFTDSKQQLLAAIDRIQPTHGQTRIEEALKLARAYTTNVNPDQQDRPIADAATLELFSDGRISDLSEQVLRGETLNYHAIGSQTADNVAIAHVSVDRPYDRPNSVEVFAAVLNFNRTSVSCDVQLSVNDVARSVQTTSVPAAQYDPKNDTLTPGRANVVFRPFEQPRGAVLEVAVLREDDLSADNLAHVVVAPPTQLSVALVTADANRSILRRVLEGMKLRSLQALTGAQFEDIASSGGGGEFDQYDVIVIDNYRPAALPPGRYLIFGPAPPLEGVNEYGDGEHQIILAARDDHPVMRYVTYDSLFISKFRLVLPGPDSQVLMEGSRGPAAVAISRGPMQVIYCTFDPLESNWPFQRSFVTFIVNAVDYLGNAGNAITQETLAPGDALSARLPAAAMDIQLLTPESRTPAPISAPEQSQWSWGPVRLAGVYVLSWKNPQTGEQEDRAYAVNVPSEAEGRIDVNPPPLKIGPDKELGRAAEVSRYRPLWPWAIGVCLAVLMLEWWVYHRKTYI